MSHFAKIENNTVTQVIVAEQDFVDTQEGQWVQTSYGTRGGKHYGPDGLEDDGEPLRKNYAGIGMIYDSVLDAFIAPKPFPSWIINPLTGYWEPPLPLPSDSATTSYIWNESLLRWVIVTPPV